MSGEEADIAQGLCLLAMAAGSNVLRKFGTKEELPVTLNGPNALEVNGGESHVMEKGPEYDVKLYLERQKQVVLKGVFDKFAEPVAIVDTIRIDSLSLPEDSDSSKPKHVALLKSTGLLKALLELGVQIELDQAEKLIVSMDIDDNGGLDFEEFKRAVQQPATPLEQWIALLPINGMLARSFPISSGPGDQMLRNVSRLGPDEIDATIDVFSDALRRQLVDSQTKLRQLFNRVDQNAAEAAKESASAVAAVSKFKTFKMRTGTVKDYVEGIAGRVGMCA
jgi:hypothetical protein